MDPNSQGGYTPTQTNQSFQQPYPPQIGMPMGMPGVGQEVPKRQRPWVLIILLTVFILLFMLATGFGVWAFMSRQDYKDRSDSKSEAAVALAVEDADAKKDAEFIEKEKSPFKVFEGPEAYGSVKITYPKTWSAYVVEAAKSSLPVDAYFHPNFVPAVASGTAFALRVQVSSQTYDQELRQFEGNIKTGKVKVSPFVTKNVPGVTGSKLTGEISKGQNGSLVLLPLRDKTLKISAGAQQFIGDFDKIILENLKFVP